MLQHNKHRQTICCLQSCLNSVGYGKVHSFYFSHIHIHTIDVLIGFAFIYGIIRNKVQSDSTAKLLGRVCLLLYLHCESCLFQFPGLSQAVWSWLGLTVLWTLPAFGSLTVVLWLCNWVFLQSADVRLEEFVYEKLEKKVPTRMNNHELLGQSMIESGNEFGPGTAYGEWQREPASRYFWTTALCINP